MNVYIQRSRSKQKGKESSSGGGPTVEEMEEKEERLRHLEEVNMSLKQTNDDLNEEVAELKRQIGDFQSKVCAIYIGGGGTRSRNRSSVFGEYLRA